MGSAIHAVEERMGQNYSNQVYRAYLEWLTMLPMSVEAVPAHYRPMLQMMFYAAFCRAFKVLVLDTSLETTEEEEQARLKSIEDELVGFVQSEKERGGK